MGAAQGSFKTGSVYGAIHAIDTGYYHSPASTGDGIRFDPSIISATYVSDGKLQPTAIQTLVCIKL